MTAPKELVERLRIIENEIVPDLNNMVRAVEDEDDRAYFGSTNDADRLAEIAYQLETIFRRERIADLIDQLSSDLSSLERMREALGEAFSTLVYIFECADDQHVSRAAKEAADKIEQALSPVAPESEG